MHLGVSFPKMVLKAKDNWIKNLRLKEGGFHRFHILFLGTQRYQGGKVLITKNQVCKILLQLPNGRENNTKSQIKVLSVILIRPPFF